MSGSTQKETYVLGATRIAVGLSAIIKITPTAYQYFNNMKMVTAGGTLEIVPVPTALTGASAAGWGNGYPFTIGEVVNSGIGGCAIYLAATGATVVVALNIGYTSWGNGMLNGATLP